MTNFLKLVDLGKIAVRIRLQTRDVHLGTLLFLFLANGTEPTLYFFVLVIDYLYLWQHVVIFVSFIVNNIEVLTRPRIR